ncbi:MAG: hypothetical protein ABFS24_12175 [Pseudomonadota bacterium]
MPDLAANMVEPVGGFDIQNMMMSYNVFVPRLYNWCKSLGFEPGKIMPSRAFCSDESQGYPIIMIAKHFGVFPFNHGMVGGIVATDRHGPHAAHGQDMLIIQASHVGYDPESNVFGTYRRAQTTKGEYSSSCGKIQHVIDWYSKEYEFARQNILLHNDEGDPVVFIDNQLLREDRDEGLFLHLDRLIQNGTSGPRVPRRILSTAKVFTPAQEFIEQVGISSFNGVSPQAIGKGLKSDMFHYERNIPQLEEGAHHLEHNMISYMPQIVSAKWPALTAAQINTQIEFDRTFRTIVKEQGYRGKKVLFIAGLHIDISPDSGQPFPLTKFVPWAAYVQDRDGYYYTLEQQELVQLLQQQSSDNPDQMNLDNAIQLMADAGEVKVEA